jgi:hypothetical protein
MSIDCKLMRSIIITVLKTHNVLDQFISGQDFHVKILNEPYMPLCIERHGSQITLTHYFEQNGDLVPDPDMEFEIGSLGEWYPVAIQFAIGTYRRCRTEDSSGKKQIRLRESLDQKQFSDMWARNIKAQGFDKGTIQKD